MYGDQIGPRPQDGNRTRNDREDDNDGMVNGSEVKNGGRRAEMMAFGRRDNGWLVENQEEQQQIKRSAIVCVPKVCVSLR